MGHRDRERKREIDGKSGWWARGESYRPTPPPPGDPGEEQRLGVTALSPGPLLSSPEPHLELTLSVLTTDDPDVRYTAVSSFIFLRFFAPAILSPNLFQLTPHHTVSEQQPL